MTIARYAIITPKQVLRHFIGSKIELAPKPVYLLKTRLDDGADRYINIDGTLTVYPKLVYFYYLHHEAVKRCAAVQTIGENRASEVLRRTRVVPILSFQFN